MIFTFWDRGPGPRPRSGGKGSGPGSKAEGLLPPGYDSNQMAIGNPRGLGEFPWGPQPSLNSKFLIEFDWKLMDIGVFCDLCIIY